MTTRVPAAAIERLVGVKRHSTDHWGKAYSMSGDVYILHSEECRATYDDLRECPFSKALDRGLDEDWHVFDEPVCLAVHDGILIIAEPEEGP